MRLVSLCLRARPATAGLSAVDLGSAPGAPGLRDRTSRPHGGACSGEIATTGLRVAGHALDRPSLEGALGHAGQFRSAPPLPLCFCRVPAARGPPAGRTPKNNSCAGHKNAGARDGPVRTSYGAPSPQIPCYFDADQPFQRYRACHYWHQLHFPSYGDPKPEVPVHSRWASWLRCRVRHPAILSLLPNCAM